MALTDTWQREGEMSIRT